MPFKNIFVYLSSFRGRPRDILIFTYLACGINICHLPWWLIGKESACQAGDESSISGLERFPGERHGNPYQYSCWENSMNRGAWRATVHGDGKRVEHYFVAKQQHIRYVLHHVEEMKPGFCHLKRKGL